MNKLEYEAFVAAVNAGRKVLPRDFEEPRYFESCMPIEVMAERGPETLRFGPMRPIGLRDPRTGHRPWAVVQLRPENKYLTAYNLVGFQTRLRDPEPQLPGTRKDNKKPRMAARANADLEAWLAALGRGASIARVAATAATAPAAELRG